MIPRRFALLIPMAALGCGSGQTIRVAEGDSTGGQPVALAPAPAPAPEPASGTTAAPPPASTNEAPAPEQPQPAGQGYAPYGNAGSLDIRRIGQWTHTGIGEARRMVIRDANTWAEFWSELGAGDRPDVDFTRNVVVAVAAGQRPTGGYEVAVDRVSQADGELRIDVVERTPGPNCVTTSAQTQPVDVVVVAGSPPRSWNFAERKEVRSCR